MPHSEEEVEIIPVSPLRRLEKRLETLETSSTFNDKEFYRELVDIIRLNQQLVDELAKSNDALRIELSRIPSRLEDLTMRLNELLTYIKAATEEPTVAGESHLGEKFDQLVEMNKKMVESNQSIVSALEEVERKLRKPTPPLPMLRKPLPKLAVQP